MIMKKIYITLAVVLGFTTASSAQQDKHFSMFNVIAGIFKPGNGRHVTTATSIIYKLQNTVDYGLAPALQNGYASVDWRMMDSLADKASNFLGAGVNFYNDPSG